jgi:hypothetical protein
MSASFSSYPPIAVCPTPKHEAVSVLQFEIAVVSDYAQRESRAPDGTRFRRAALLCRVVVLNDQAEERYTPQVRLERLLDRHRAGHTTRRWVPFYRRLCSRMDTPRANTAVAHKLARMVYLMLTRGENYVDRGREHYEEQQRQRTVAALKRRAKAFGFELTPAPVTT